MAKKKKPVKKAKKKASAAQGEKAGEEASEEGEVRPEAGAQESIQEEDAQRNHARKATSVELTGYRPKGLAPPRAGNRATSRAFPADPESILKASRNFWKRGKLSKRKLSPGVENAADPDVSEVITHQFPEDDVPEEYKDPDKD